MAEKRFQQLGIVVAFIHDAILLLFLDEVSLYVCPLGIELIPIYLALLILEQEPDGTVEKGVLLCFDDTTFPFGMVGNLNGLGDFFIPSTSQYGCG